LGEIIAIFGLFDLAIILTMFALMLAIDDPEPNKCKWLFEAMHRPIIAQFETLNIAVFVN